MMKRTFVPPNLLVMWISPNSKAFNEDPSNPRAYLLTATKEAGIIARSLGCPLAVMEFPYQGRIFNITGLSILVRALDAYALNRRDSRILHCIYSSYPITQPRVQKYVGYQPSRSLAPLVEYLVDVYEDGHAWRKARPWALIPPLHVDAVEGWKRNNAIEQEERAVS